MSLSEYAKVVLGLLLGCTLALGTIYLIYNWLPPDYN